MYTIKLTGKKTSKNKIHTVLLKEFLSLTITLSAHKIDNTAVITKYQTKTSATHMLSNIRIATWANISMPKKPNLKRPMKFESVFILNISSFLRGILLKLFLIIKA